MGGAKIPNIWLLYRLLSEQLLNALHTHWMPPLAHEGLDIYAISLFNQPPYSRTIKLAIPMPVPIHLLSTPTLSPLLPISAKSVANMRPLVAPNGCPSAIAPPFGFTLSILFSSPSARTQCSASQTPR
jgi:hypothetical protein